MHEDLNKNAADTYTYVTICWNRWITILCPQTSTPYALNYAQAVRKKQCVQLVVFQQSSIHQFVGPSKSRLPREHAFSRSQS
jgi:hypothetical protein